MKTAAQTSFPERVGRVLGRLWRTCARMDQQANRWLVANGWPRAFANALLLVTKVAVFGVLLYAGFWLGLVLLAVMVAAWAARNTDCDEPLDWAIGDRADHKRSVFYDPINYDDDPDPRFPDKQ